MTQAMVTMPISFESLVEAVKLLGAIEQRDLYSILEDEIVALEEALIDDDPMLRQGILDAKAAYNAGDFITLGEYVAQQDGAA